MLMYHINMLHRFLMLQKLLLQTCKNFKTRYLICYFVLGYKKDETIKEKWKIKKEKQARKNYGEKV